MPGLAFYVSGHGFGHATRCVALLRALRARAPELPLHVRSQAPHWIFTERDARVETSAAAVDPGVIQSSGLDLDLEATLAAHQAFLAGWDAAVEREAAFLRELRPALVVGDVPPLAFAAAARAALPAVAIANFSWEWIFSVWAREDPRWRPMAERYGAAYAPAEQAFRLPLHSSEDFSCFGRVTDTGLLVNRSRRSREACRTALGGAPDDPRRWVLVSFGGFGPSAFRGAADPGLSGTLFVGLEPGAPRGFPGEWILLERPSPIAHEDLMQACDAVLGKAGYGTIAEALAHDTRFLYLPRENFPEVPVLEAALEAFGAARPMTREAFESGRWGEALDALFRLPPRHCGLATDGAEQISAALLARIGRDA